MAMGNKRKNVRAGAAVEPLETRQLMSVLYVSNSGNDGNSGSQASPLATLQAALNDAQSGDTIILRGGTYSGNFWITKPNLTLTSYQGETARLFAASMEKHGGLISLEEAAEEEKLLRIALAEKLTFAGVTMSRVRLWENEGSSVTYWEG